MSMDESGGMVGKLCGSIREGQTVNANDGEDNRATI